jgi:hypothetical protein
MPGVQRGHRLVGQNGGRYAGRCYRPPVLLRPKGMTKCASASSCS